MNSNLEVLLNYLSNKIKITERIKPFSNLIQ